MTESSKKTKLILVSNRLPVTVERTPEGYKYNPSVGGLATGLSSLNSTYDCRWVGYCGIPWNKIPEDDAVTINSTLKSTFNSQPVHITSHEIKQYYNGFSNKTLWPLFHYFPYFTEYEKDTWEMYYKVNEKFCEQVVSLITPEEETTIWIHDYHLMLLPKMIREKFPKVKIGFFLHIPFPSSEIFRLLPWRKELLEGVLGSDLIGFHTHRYVRHFLSSILYILGLENTFGTIDAGARIIRVDTFPMGIDYERFSGAHKEPAYKEEIKDIESKIIGKKVIVSIDRLDYTKGILKRLEAYDHFLSKYPDHQEKVILIVLAVPSRTDIDSYRGLKSKVDESIGRINGKYSTLDWTPIWYLYRSLPFLKLTPLYAISDIALVTPVRDGMNLVAKEYVACQNTKKGVLIISEMAGVADELGEAIIVNPNSTDEIADALYAALSMSEEEKSERLASMQKRLKRNNVFKWAGDFIDKLQSFDNIQKIIIQKIFSDDDQKTLLDDYNKRRNRLILLDYDGTLVPFKEKPADAKPDKDLLQILDHLAGNPHNELVLISGRDKDILNKWFKNQDMALIAEHGCWIKKKNMEWESTVPGDAPWKKDVLPILERYIDRTPGTFIEEKSHSLVWHYRKADQELAFIRLRELKSDLLTMIANLDLGILEGNKVLEIKSFHMNKGKAATQYINGTAYDFILAIGDDLTDEDLFSVLPPTSYSFKVGLTLTKARYNIFTYREVRMLLKYLQETYSNGKILV